MEPTRQPASFTGALKLPFYFLALIWAIMLLERLLQIDLGSLGILPRETSGLKGIFFAPLLHGGWNHLISNSVPFLVLSVMTLYFYPRIALRAIVMIYFVSGIGVWAFARPWVYHIGLSYVVYGLASFVFWNGVFRRSVRSIILSLIVTLLYSGMFAGLIPSEEVLLKNISWESHLIGVFVGLFTSYYYKEEMEEDEVRQPPSHEEDKQPYFDPTVFDKTKEKRRLEAIERERQAASDKSAPPSGGWFSSHT